MSNKLAFIVGFTSGMLIIFAGILAEIWKLANKEW